MSCPIVNLRIRRERIKVFKKKRRKKKISRNLIIPRPREVF
jgi:hypothetical protein